MIDKAQFHVKVPLVIGITGHRDLRHGDRKDLEDTVRDIFKEIADKAHYPHTPLILLSPLAEGADRLVARVFLGLKNGPEDRNFRLVVPLPMSQALYEKDFEKDLSSLEEFRTLLKQADHTVEMPLVQGNTEETIREQGPARDLQYAEVGMYVAHQCQILVALWNGKESGKVGGAAEVVASKRKGETQWAEHPPFRGRLEPSECGPVYQIVTPRREDPAVEGRPFNVHRLFPYNFSSDSAAEQYYHAIFRSIDAFNQDLERHGPRLDRDVLKSKAYLLPEDKQRDLSTRVAELFDRYAIADALAIHYQRRTNWTQWCVHALVFNGFIFFELFAHWDFMEHIGKTVAEKGTLAGFGLTLFRLASHIHLRGLACWVWKTQFLVLYPALLALAFACYFWASWRDCQNKYQDYRSLAEGLRVQFFWRVAGLEDSAAEYYLGKQRTELDWVRNALRSWNIPSGARRNPSEGELGLVLKYWVDDQHNYFQNRPDARIAARTEKLAGGLLVFFGLVLPASVVGWLSTSDFALESWEHASIVLVITIPLIWAGLYHHYAQKMAYSEHAKQYDRMRSLFGHALRVITRTVDIRAFGDAQVLLRDLGIAALGENGDWVLLHRERRLEVPHVG